MSWREGSREHGPEDPPGAPLWPDRAASELAALDRAVPTIQLVQLAVLLAALGGGRPHPADG